MKKLIIFILILAIVNNAHSQIRTIDSNATYKANIDIQLKNTFRNWKTHITNISLMGITINNELKINDSVELYKYFNKIIDINNLGSFYQSNSKNVTFHALSKTFVKDNVINHEIYNQYKDLVLSSMCVGDNIINVSFKFVDQTTLNEFSIEEVLVYDSIGIKFDNILYFLFFSNN